MKWKDRWYITSHSNDERQYTVALSEDGVWGCSCPAWKFQRKRLVDGKCKHIREVLSWKDKDSFIMPDHITHDDFFAEEEFVL